VKGGSCAFYPELCDKENQRKYEKEWRRVVAEENYRQNMERQNAKQMQEELDREKRTIKVTNFLLICAGGGLGGMLGGVLGGVVGAAVGGASGLEPIPKPLFV